MCCRYVLTKDHAKSLLDKLGVLLEADALPASRHNIPPGAPILAVRNRLDDRGERELAPLQWGLVPAWASAADKPVVNARAETLADKPTFRDAVRTRRCLIPASGFYEWKPVGRARQPWFFRLRDDRPFALAGLWDSWRAADGTRLESCVVVTSAPNDLMSPIHHRMPVILPDPAAWDAWLDPRNNSLDTLAPLLRPFRSDAMTASPVSDRVNSIRNDDPGCLEPAEPREDPQLSLGL